MVATACPGLALAAHHGIVPLLGCSIAALRYPPRPVDNSAWPGPIAPSQGGGGCVGVYLWIFLAAPPMFRPLDNGHSACLMRKDKPLIG